MQRRWGKWATAIREYSKGVKLWLDTYNVTQEVSQSCDKETMKINGPYALANFKGSCTPYTSRRNPPREAKKQIYDRQ